MSNEVAGIQIGLESSRPVSFLHAPRRISWGCPDSWRRATSPAATADPRHTPDRSVAALR